MKFDEVLSKEIEESVEKQGKIVGEKLFKTVCARVIKDLEVVRPIEIKIGEKKVVPKGVQHEKLSTVLQYMQSNLSLLLVGHAGSGKTHIAVVCAETLGYDHYSISVNEQTSKADFLGFNDATGNIVKTNFRKAYEDGGVFIIDEIDAGNPNILTVINSALSNDFCPFPDKMVKRHEKFICVCTANTFGDGESFQYIGRNVLDSATKDRFVCVFIDYSPTLEKILIPNYYELILALRKHFTDKGYNFIISTRGGIRLESLRGAVGKLPADSIIDCLNLHQEVVKDYAVNNIIAKHV